MKSSVGKGIIVLTFSGIVCKIFGAFFRLPLTYILGVDGIGVFQLVMSLFSFALVLTSGGISVTLSKLISSYRARRQYGKIKWNIYLAFMFCIVSSFVIGLCFLFLAKEIALLQKTNDTVLSYRLFFPLLLFSSLVALFRGVYQGYEDMTPTAVSQIIEQTIKVVFGLLFAFLFSKYSIEMGVAGAFFGIILAEFLAFIYLYLCRHKVNLRRYKTVITCRSEFYSHLVPASLSLAISAFVHFFDGLIIVERLSKAGLSVDFGRSLFGLQTGVVGSILNFPIIISFALATAILPKLSFEKYSKKDKSAKNIRQSFKILWITVLPITFGLLAISAPLYQIVYPFFDAKTLDYAVKLTAIGSVATISFAVMQFFISILQARGEFNYVLFSLIFGGIGKILCTLFLCANSEINVFGLPIGNLVFATLTLFLCFMKIKKIISIDFNTVFIPLISSLVMLVLVGYLVAVLTFMPIAKFILGVCVGVAVYAILTFPLLKSLRLPFFGNKKLRRRSEQK